MTRSFRHFIAFFSLLTAAACRSESPRGGSVGSARVDSLRLPEDSEELMVDPDSLRSNGDTVSGLVRQPPSAPESPSWRSLGWVLGDSLWLRGDSVELKVDIPSLRAQGDTVSGWLYQRLSALETLRHFRQKIDAISVRFDFVRVDCRALTMEVLQSHQGGPNGLGDPIALPHAGARATGPTAALASAVRTFCESRSPLR